MLSPWPRSTIIVAPSTALKFAYENLPATSQQPIATAAGKSAPLAPMFGKLAIYLLNIRRAINGIYDNTQYDVGR
jgi:hypothetical protein